ncbi:MAG: ABC transporter permease [Actinobacteria bacterium]|nr:ABC transporter permease [Actinomycetota bacterium]
MSLRRILSIMRKSLNPKNPYIIFVLLGPFIYAALFQFVFGLWQAKPKVAVYERGNQAIVLEIREKEAVGLVEADSADDLIKMVEDKEVDIGAVFAEDAEERLTAGERTSVDIYVNGESLAKSRAIALATITSAVREISPGTPQVDFEQVKLGKEKALSLMEMFMPFFIIIIILLGAFLLPASFIVAEKEKRTLAALLVTPTTFSEILLAFGTVGIIISLAMGMILLLLTVGITQPLLLLIIFAFGSILGAEWGLVFGLLSKDQASLIAYIKVINIFIIAPALFVIFPSWPQWIAKIFPTYYIANPIFRISIYGEGWSELGWQVLALAGFVAVFFIPLLVLAIRSVKSTKARLLTVSS